MYAGRIIWPWPLGKVGALNRSALGCSMVVACTNRGALEACHWVGALKRGALGCSMVVACTKRGAAPDSYCLVWVAHMRATYCYEIQRIITYLGSVLLVALSQINVSFSHTFC